MPRYEVFGRGPVVAVPPSQFDLRQLLTIGSYKPDATTCGLLPDRPLTVFEGNLTAVDGQVIRDLEIRGRVTCTDVSNVTIDNCWVRGGTTAPTTNRGLVHVTGTASNILVRDCLLEPQVPNQWWDGIRTHDFTALRCRIRKVTDAFGVFQQPGTAAGTPTGVRILGCWVETLTRFATSSEHADGTHNDAVEIQGGYGTVIRGTRLESYLDPGSGDAGGLNRQSPQRTTGNACVQFANNVGPIADTIIEQNWLYGGEYGLNASVGKFGGGTGNVVRDNQFDHGQTGAQVIGGNTTYTINLDSAAGITFSNNRYEDNQVAVQIRRPT